MALRLGLAGLGTAGRAVPLAIAKVPGYEFAAGADNRKEARDQYRLQYGIKVQVESLLKVRYRRAFYVTSRNRPYR
jgi:hypothetical protein